MTRWRKWLRALIAVFGVSFAIVLFVTIRDAKRPSRTVPNVTRLDATAAAEATKGTVRSLGARTEKWNVEFEHSLAYADGRQKLTGVRAVVPQRDGRSFRLKGNEAEIGPRQEQLVMRGAVEMTSSDGFVGHTEEASFNQTEGVLRTPLDFSFTRNRLSGSSTGMTYDQNRDIISLLERAVLMMAPSTAAGAATTIDAGTAVMARRDHYDRFERGFRLVNGTRVLESDSATAYLTDDDATVTSLEMRGNSRISGLGEGAGAVRMMHADDMNLEFADDGRTLQGATLSRNAVVDMGDAGDGGGARSVSADWIDVRLLPDGSTVSALTARDNMILTLPASKDEPKRVITAATLAAKGEPGKGLTSAKLVGNAEYRELRETATGRVIRRVSGRMLDLATEPGLGDIDEARFSGAVRFDDPPLRASSGTARYLVKRGAIELDGNDETTGLMPRVTDGQVTIDARKISIAVDQRQVIATKDVRSAMLPASAAGAGGGVHRASMLKQDQPVYATADQLAYDGLKHLAVYTTNARLWQGDTAISGDTVTVDDASGNLSSKGHVRSTLMLEQTDPKTKRVDRMSSIATADTMTYQEAQRRATYTTNAHASGPQGDLHASTIEMYLKVSGSELDRVEAYTNVTTRDATRFATGDRLTYFADDGRYVMLGAPVTVCADMRETTGRTLKFFKDSNTITVDGNEELRTEMKGGAKCGEARKH
ncbi:MAG: LPS export ABC transporter periplasmic protein LptC [Acidobacteria bacterium]|nr:LPS export ABC transporter periplasmic protein LptC [Acidobacteriota bacterium]